MFIYIGEYYYGYCTPLVSISCISLNASPRRFFFVFLFLFFLFCSVARMRKFELAARRINKLINFTQVNDKMKAEYDDKSKALRAHLDKVNKQRPERRLRNSSGGGQISSARDIGVSHLDFSIVFLVHESRARDTLASALCFICECD